MSKVMPILDAPYSKPVDVVDGQISGQLDLDVFSLITPQDVVASEFIRNFNAHDVWHRAIAHEEVGVWPGSVIVEIRNVEGLRI